VRHSVVKLYITSVLSSATCERKILEIFVVLLEDRFCAVLNTYALISGVSLNRYFLLIASHVHSLIDIKRTLLNRHLMP